MGQELLCKLIDKNPLAGQNVSEVLSPLDNLSARARHTYLDFVEVGIVKGQRPELIGGGAQTVPTKTQRFQTQSSAL